MQGERRGKQEAAGVNGDRWKLRRGKKVPNYMQRAKGIFKREKGKRCKAVKRGVDCGHARGGGVVREGPVVVCWDEMGWERRCRRRIELGWPGHASPLAGPLSLIHGLARAKSRKRGLKNRFITMPFF